MNEKKQKRLELKRLSVSRLNPEQQESLQGGATTTCVSKYIACVTAACVTALTCPVSRVICAVTIKGCTITS